MISKATKVALAILKGWCIVDPLQANCLICTVYREDYCFGHQYKYSRSKW